MDDPMPLLAAAGEEAAELRLHAGRLTDVLGQAVAELERARYHCEAGRRDRERLALVARRIGGCGAALREAAAALLGGAQALAGEP